MSWRIVTVETPKRCDRSELRTKPLRRAMSAIEARRSSFTIRAKSKPPERQSCSRGRLTFQFESYLSSSPKARRRRSPCFREGTAMAKTIALLATLDTKGGEVAYIRDFIEARGHRALVIDTGLIGEPATRADVSNPKVAEAGGSSLAALRAHADREESGAGHGRRRDQDHARAGRTGKIHAARRTRRHAGHDARHRSHARAALWLSQDHGLDHGLGQCRPVGRHQRHHHDVSR